MRWPLPKRWAVCYAFPFEDPEMEFVLTESYGGLRGPSGHSVKSNLRGWKNRLASGFAPLVFDQKEDADRVAIEVQLEFETVYVTKTWVEEVG